MPSLAKPLKKYVSLNQMIQEKIKSLIKDKILYFCGGEFPGNLEVDLEHPSELNNGDYSTNVAKKYFGPISRTFEQSKGTWTVWRSTNETERFNNPIGFAESLAGELNKSLIPEIQKVEAKNGFINFFLSKEFFVESVKEILVNKYFGKNEILKDKKVMVEYTDPNPFKPFHIGHLMSNSIGESVSRLVEYSGAETIRANYQGDVGLHVAKAIWGLKQYPELNIVGEESVELKAFQIGKAYSLGSEAYEDENRPEVKIEIDEINKKIYDKSNQEINEVYEWGREITLEAFEKIYAMLGTKFKSDCYFFESVMAPIGLKVVKENTPNLFEESDGAIVFKADKYDPKLHTRVFINSKGLPTYETKEIGLTVTKFKQENPDLSIVITATEQGDYMRVVQKALSLIHPEYESRMKHITHGMLRFASGKMSSRKGNVVTGESLLNDVKHLVYEKIQDRDFTEDEKQIVSSQVGVGALKYSILKQASGGDIIYDFEKSISFEGDSGPYMQYSYARAQSLVEKAKKEGIEPSIENTPEEITHLEKMLYRFPKVVYRASSEFEPHYVANYLIELSRTYNSFYGNTQIINKEDKTSAYKVALTLAFAEVMQKGLYLLGIETPEKM